MRVTTAVVPVIAGAAAVVLAASPAGAHVRARMSVGVAAVGVLLLG
jgi:hypothetical protein